MASLFYAKRNRYISLVLDYSGSYTLLTRDYTKGTNTILKWRGMKKFSLIFGKSFTNIRLCKTHNAIIK